MSNKTRMLAQAERLSGYNDKEVLSIKAGASEREYTFVEINNVYYCINTSKWKMFVCLMNKFKPLSIVEEQAKGGSPATILTKAFKVVRLLMYIQRGVYRRQFRTVKLPVYGQLAMYKKTHDAFIVFDSDAGAVTTVHMSPSSSDRKQRVAYLRKIGEAGIGPEILEANDRGNWYKEEFLNHSHERHCRKHGSELLKREVMQFIGRIIGQFPVKQVSLTGYVSELESRMPANLHQRSELKHKMERLVSFIALLRDRLAFGEQYRVYIVFSHGDVHVKNMIRKEGRLIGIDWEFMDWRSLLYDAYYFCNYADLKPDASYLLDELERREGCEGIDVSAVHTSVYRDLFYLEYVMHWLCIVGGRLEQLSPDRIHTVLDKVIHQADTYQDIIQGVNANGKHGAKIV